MIRLNYRSVCLLLFINIFSFNTIRRCFTVAGPLLIESEPEYNKNAIGAIQSLFYIFNGISKFISAFLVESFSSSLLLSSALFINGVGCLVIAVLPLQKPGFYSSVWGLLGFLQGISWPAVAVILVKWVPSNKRGLAWSVVTFAGLAAQAIFPTIIAHLFQYLGSQWRTPFWINGGSAVFVAAICYLTLRDAPVEGSSSKKQENKVFKGNKVECGSTFDPMFILLTTGTFLTIMITKVYNEWLLFELREKGYELVSATQLLFAFESGLAVGSFLAGPLSDWVVEQVSRSKGRVIVMLASVIVAFMLQVCMFWRANSFWSESFPHLFILGFFLTGNKVLAGLVIREAISKGRVRATRVALLGFSGQLAAACAGYPVAVIIESAGIQTVHRLLASLCFCSVIAVGCGYRHCSFSVVERAKKRMKDI